MRGPCATKDTESISHTPHKDNKACRRIQASLLTAATGWRRVVRRDSFLEPPASALTHEGVVIAPGLRDRRASFTGDDERPPRPRGGGVAGDRDHEVRQQ